MVKCDAMLRNFASKLIRRLLASEFNAVREDVDVTKLLVARLLIGQMKARGDINSLRDVEFKVYSQFGDDGIIQYLIHRLAIPSECASFIEFGIQEYKESNTRFLLGNDNWRGLVLDGDPANIGIVSRSTEYWRHDLMAVAAFIDRDNVNDLFTDNGFSGEIGLLSIDIDGNDYWVWERISVVNPRIVVVEYNSVFGPDFAVSIPYQPDFKRTVAHHSNLYWGASLKALALLGAKKGYALVGSNSAGNNAYFVRRDCLSGLPELSVAEAYVESRFRESRDAGGQLTYLSGTQRIAEIRTMPLHSFEHNKVMAISELYGV